MDELDELFGRAAAIDGARWRDAPMPAAEDEWMAAAVRALAALPADQRVAKAAALARPPLSRRVETFARRMSALAVRTRDAGRLRDAALVLALSGCLARGAYMLLFVVDDAAGRLGLDGPTVLREAAVFASPAGRGRMEEVASLPERRMASVGWRAVETPEGLDYRSALAPPRPATS